VASGPSSAGDDLLGMEIDFRAYRVTARKRKFPDRHQAASWADFLRNPCGIRPDRVSPRSAKTPDPRVNPRVSANDMDQTS
jgi:hypothetical protein